MQQVSIPIGDRQLTLETGKVAQQADGSVWLRCNGSVMLATTTASNSKEGRALSFLGMTVHYQEKTYATGRIPSNYNRRQGKRTDREVLVARQVDRSLRPMFAPQFRDYIDVTVEALSIDDKAFSESLSILAGSAALYLSPMPFDKPVGALRVLQSDKGLSFCQRSTPPKSPHLDLLVTASDEGIVMVEGNAQFATHDEIFEALTFAQDHIQPMLKAQHELRRQCERAGWVFPGWEPDTKAPLADDTSEIREAIINEQQRSDNRAFDAVRPINCEVGILQRPHGSALYTRGKSQALVVVTLGGQEDEQHTDAIHGMRRKPFYLHYNFPSYATGKTGRFGIWGRREIGHGQLAEHALLPAIPSRKDFPYTISVVSEVMSANGSTSMATVCGATLAMLSTGVPLSTPIAGTSLAMFQDKDKQWLLSDPTGEEDQCGDMDLKVCGDHERITALHLDLKIPGISLALLRQALEQAQRNRQQIIDTMNQCIKEPDAISPNAPHFRKMEVPTATAKNLLGHGGKKLKQLKDTSKAKIQVQASGQVAIYAPNRASLEKALSFLASVDTDKHEDSTARELMTPGSIYPGKVAHIKPYGAFIKLENGQSGLLHLSEMAEETEGLSPEDIVSVGQELSVRLLPPDKKGRMGFSLKQPKAEPKEKTSESTPDTKDKTNE
jgi:polyribonucleotide nucleotidyltransferase